MHRLEQICLSGAVSAVKQIHPRMGIQLHLLIIPEVFQFQLFNPHFLSDNRKRPSPMTEQPFSEFPSC
jgi:hypothetical protein